MAEPAQIIISCMLNVRKFSRRLSVR